MKSSLCVRAGTVVLVAMLLLIGRGYPVAAQNEIRIGLIGPLTGLLAVAGSGMKQGAELAVEEINAAGGINGRKVVLYPEDDQANPAESVSALKRLIEEKGVLAVIGPIQATAMLAMSKINKEAGVVLLSPTASAPIITKQGNPYMFRNCPTAPVLSGNVAKYAVQTLGLKRFAIVTQNDDFGRTNGDAFAAAAKELGATVVANESHLPDDKDFKGQLIKIKAQRPDALFLTGFYAPGALVAKQAREIGLNVQLLATNPMAAPPYRTIGGKAVDGTIFSAFYFPGAFTNKEAAEFVTKWKKRFGAEPNVYHGPAYDDMLLIAEAIRRKGATRQGIRDGLASIKDFPGVSGYTSFDEYGDVIKKIVILKVEGNEVKPITTM